MNCRDETFMRRALELAGLSASEGEVAVGAVVTDGGRIIGEGRNRRESGNDATAHAEIEAIRGACRTRGSWRLDGCAIYVTLEPCAMCAGAIINSRISRVVIGARQPKTGCCGSVCNLFAMEFSTLPSVVFGVLEDESAALLAGFFENRVRPDK